MHAAPGRRESPDARGPNSKNYRTPPTVDGHNMNQPLLER